MRVERERDRNRLRGNGVVAVVAALLLIAGCRPDAPTGNEPFLIATATAAVAFAEAEIERERPATPQSTCDACDGTGSVPSGDGLARVPCECGAACRCEPSSATSEERPGSTARRKRLLCFSATWCASCRANEAALSALADRGWRIGPGEDNHIQTIDVDEHPDMQARYAVTAVPTWMLIDDGTIVHRRCGILDPFEVGRLFDE
ncbi:MAG: thioredoxin family protein [Planctomycetaceae bacterium]